MSQTEQQKQSQVEAQGGESGVATESPLPAPVRPHLSMASCLVDLQAWIEFALQSVKYRSGRIPPTFTDGYSYVEVPEWSMRQKLDNIRTTLQEHRSAAINTLSDELVARAKAELEDWQWFHDLKTNAEEDEAIFSLALEMQEKERLSAIVAQTTRLDTLRSAEQVRRDHD